MGINRQVQRHVRTKYRFSETKPYSNLSVNKAASTPAFGVVDDILESDPMGSRPGLKSRFD